MREREKRGQRGGEVAGGNMKGGRVIWSSRRKRGKRKGGGVGGVYYGFRDLVGGSLGKVNLSRVFWVF